MTTIENVELFGLDSSIFRSGYSMLDTAPTPQAFQEAVSASAGKPVTTPIPISSAPLSWHPCPKAATISFSQALWSTLT